MKNQLTVRSGIRSKLPIIQLSLWGLASCLMIIWTLALSQYMRPVQDDYGIAFYSVDLGVFRATWEMYLTWNGGLVGQIILHFYIWLMAVLPSQIAYLPWVATCSLLALWVIQYFWKVIAPNRSQQSIWKYTFIGYIAWQFVIFGPGLTDNFTNAYVFYGWISGANRLLFSMIVVLVLLRYCKHQSLFRTPSVFAGFGIGLVLGLWNLVEAATIAGTAALIAVWLLTAKRKIDNKIAEILSISAGAITAGAINYFSPGNLLRSEQMPRPPVSETIFTGMNTLAEVWSGTIGEISFGFAWLFIICALLIRLPLGQKLGVAYKGKSNQKVHMDTCSFFSSRIQMNRTLIVISLFTLVEIGAVTLSSTFSYYGYWHIYGLFLPILLILLILGVLFTESIQKQKVNQKLTSFVSIAMFSGLMVLLIFQLMRFNSQVVERAEIWDSGAPAPFGLIYDRDVDWVNSGWIQYKSVKTN